MTIEPKHTPTPWEVTRDSGGKSYISGKRVMGYGPIAMLLTYGEPCDRENAAFIVHCVNNAHKIDAHDELVAALDMVAEFDARLIKHIKGYEWGAAALQAVHQALAKARGEA